MTLVDVDLPSPNELRGGWAAFAAVTAARGWRDSAEATATRWEFHDGGGNWASLRIMGPGRITLVGHDHEYTETYYGDGATYFGEEETDLLAGAPDWWSFDLDPGPNGEWIGFVYGWDGGRWQRAPYNANDGFASIGLLQHCSVGGTDALAEFARSAPELGGVVPAPSALDALVAADADVTAPLVEAVVPGLDVDAGVRAARAFLTADIG